MISNSLQEKINHSYEVLTLAAKMSKLYYQKPLMLCYSGGKDSDVMLQLAIECLDANEFEVINSHTTVDAPETVYYIRERFAELNDKGIKSCVLYPTFKDGSPKSMWNLIPTKSMPPTRLQRYCCAQLKEVSTPNRFIAVGVRESESNLRKGRDDFATKGRTKTDALHYDYSHVKDVFDTSERERESIGGNPNDADVYDCKIIEQAKKQKQLICNPIYKWLDSDIWYFIRDRGMKYNPLYDCGYHRVGCIGCPMSSKQQYELERYPIYRDNYIKAFQRMLNEMDRKGLKTKRNWKNGDDVYKWWVQDETLDGQMNLFDNADINNNERSS